MRFCALFLALGFMGEPAWELSAAELPPLAIPDSLGVNIHFTDPQPGEMAMLARGGFRWVRMDFAWEGTERQKGQYDFSAYDRLLKALAPHKIRALFILDYSNRHYDKGQSPASDEGRKAFARWAAAAARHFRGRGILWEMYNEPNIGFWRPKPDVKVYVKLALEVGRALRQAEPGEMYIGPATAEIDFHFLEECFKAGLLEYWCAVSVHPYRQNAPETAAPEYARLRRLIRQYAPKGKNIPILSGEWGYSSAWKGYDPTRQGKQLPRQFLINLANEVPLSIWYDWHDDGPDPREPEHHFGTVLYPYHANRDPVYDPKPAYRAAKTLASVLDGCRFNKRLAVGGPDDYVLLFSRGEEIRLAAWTTSTTPHKVVIPASPGEFQITGYTGESQPSLKANQGGLELSLHDTPQYLAPVGVNELLAVAAAWQRVPLELTLPAQKKAAVSLSLKNPLSRPIRISSSGDSWIEVKPGQTAVLTHHFAVPRQAEPVRLVVDCFVDGFGRLSQKLEIQAANPLGVLLGPPANKTLMVRVENPSGEPFQGKICLTKIQGLQISQKVIDLQILAGQREKDVAFAYENGPVREYRLGVSIEDRQDGTQLVLEPLSRVLVDNFALYSSQTLGGAWKMVPDGDPKITSSQSVSVAPAPPGSPASTGQALRITYQMQRGWKFIRLVSQTEVLRTIQGRPRELGLWLFGDASHNLPRLRFVDATGQTFQPSSAPITWKGWRYVRFFMDGREAGHWGGANDGIVHYPIRWDSLFLIDSTRRESSPREVWLAGPVLTY